MSASRLFLDELGQSQSAITYRVSQKLAELRPGKAVIETSGGLFDLQQFADGGRCRITLNSEIHQEIETVWNGPDEGCSQKAVNAWYEVSWNGASLEVVSLTLSYLHHVEVYQWIIAETADIARAFYEAACEWCHEVRGEILVFRGGCWQKDRRLYAAVEAARYDDLILQGTLKQEIFRDLEQFLSSRALYEEYGVPWKRGILFLGPPGNGKTHCLKVLIKRLARPCLYVQSFKSMYATEQAGIHEVFHHTRQSAPCLLVLEDLDSLLTPESRAYFLNELDGFAENRGVITLATTNHPEKLDASILDRPSRFDMKYHFDLPGYEERREYLAQWNSRLHPQMQMSLPEIEAVAGCTEAFSFAYLKELVVCSITRWMQGARQGSLAGTMQAQVDTLRLQMSIEPAPPSSAILGPEGD